MSGFSLRALPRWKWTSNLRDFAELEKDVVLVGVASRIEIWSKARWEGITEDEDEAMEDIAERMADLGLGI